MRKTTTAFPILPAIAFDQAVTPPFRAETGVPPQLLPVYAALHPPIPPYLPYRKVSFYPNFPSYQQLTQAVTPRNLWLPFRAKE